MDQRNRNRSSNPATRNRSTLHSRSRGFHAGVSMHKGVHYAFSPRELVYFLFKKKRCPQCSGKLVRNKSFVTGEEKGPGSTIQHREFTYNCPTCLADFGLGELAEQ